jgi:hypothetical protein
VDFSFKYFVMMMTSKKYELRFAGEGVSSERLLLPALDSMPVQISG